MKIKDVCLQTGLTDRTIRFYIEKGLLNVNASDINGRNYREYSEEDVEILNDISKLRKAKFSVQDILDMQNANKCLDEIVASHYYQLEQEQHANEIILTRLKKIQGRNNISWRKLANILLSNEETKIEGLRNLTDDEPVIIESRSVKEYVKIIIITLVVFVVLLASSIVIIRHRYNQRTMLTFFNISEVRVLDKWTEAGEGYVFLSTKEEGAVGYDDYFFEGKALRVKNDDYYHAIMTGEDSYQSISVRMEIPYNEAKALGVLDDNGNVQIEKVLLNQDYVKDYCVIESVMQDDKYH